LPSDGEWAILSDYVIANTTGTSTSDIGPFLKATIRLERLTLESLLMMLLGSPAYLGFLRLTTMAATMVWATPCLLVVVDSE
jgi:hypothetical protein